MSKLDDARGLSLGHEARKKPDMDLNEMETTEMRLELLNQQEMQRLKNTSELIRLLKDLRNSINQAEMNVQKAANTVKDYPAEAVRQATAQTEQAVRSCAEAANRAQQVYDEAVKLVDTLHFYVPLWIFGASMAAGLIWSTFMVWFFKR